MSAVIWTDVIQMFVLWLGALLSIVFLVTSLPGGWSDVFTFGTQSGMFNAIDLTLDPSVTYSLWAGLLGGFFLHVAYFGTDQSQIQRVLSSPSVLDAQRSLLLGTFLLAILSHRSNARGAVSGLITGMLAAWSVSSLLDISWLYNNTIGVVVSVSVGYLVSLTTTAPRAEQLTDVMMEETAPDMQAILAARGANASEVGHEARLTRRRCIGLFLWFGLMLGLLALLQGRANG